LLGKRLESYLLDVQMNVKPCSYKLHLSTSLMLISLLLHNTSSSAIAEGPRDALSQLSAAAQLPKITFD